MAMLGNERFTVERLIADFDRETVPRLERETSGCWDQLTQVAAQ